MAMRNLKKVSMSGCHTEFDMLVQELHFSSFFHNNKNFNNNYQIISSENSTKQPLYLNVEKYIILKECCNYFKQFNFKKSLWEKIPMKATLFFNRYYKNIINSFDIKAFVEDIRSLRNQIIILKIEGSKLIKENWELEKLRLLQMPNEYIGKKGHVSFLLGFVGETTVEELQSIKRINVDIVKKINEKVYVLVTFFFNEYSRIINDLGNMNFVQINSDFIEIITENCLNNNKKKLEGIDKELKRTLLKLKKLYRKFSTLETVLEYYNSHLPDTCQVSSTSGQSL